MCNQMFCVSIWQDVYITGCVNEELLERVIRDCFPWLKVLLDGTSFMYILNYLRKISKIFIHMKASLGNSDEFPADHCISVAIIPYHGHCWPYEFTSRLFIWPVSCFYHVTDITIESTTCHAYVIRAVVLVMDFDNILVRLNRDAPRREMRDRIE